jgi:hypothetical protein
MSYQHQLSSRCLLYERRGEQGDDMEDAEFKTKIKRKMISRNGKNPGDEKNIDPELIFLITPV